MRTTIMVPDDILISAKKKAIERRTTLGRFITDSIVAAVNSAPPARTARTWHLPTFKGTGLLPGAHLDSTAELLDFMEGRR